MTLATSPGERPDFDYVNGGSVILMVPLTSDARRWIMKHIEEDVPRLGQGFAVEPRYFASLLEAIALDGLAVRS